MKTHQMKLAWKIRYVRTWRPFLRNAADLKLFVATKAYIFLFLKNKIQHTQNGKNLLHDCQLALGGRHWTAVCFVTGLIQVHYRSIKWGRGLPLFKGGQIWGKHVSELKGYID